MEDLINAVMLTDTVTLYMVIGLSVLWSYLLFEAIGSKGVAIFGLPLFIVFSLIAVHYLRLNTASSDELNIVTGSGIGSVIGLLATLLSVRLMQALGRSGGA